MAWDRADGVLVSWSADARIRPTIVAHASDPGVRTHVTNTGIRSALDQALATLFLHAGLHTAAPADGLPLVTRHPPAARQAVSLLLHC
ncbi:hypothetical protein [Streptomyces sp. NBC_01353]|uniref:hypothetical protein n=1 Tax=Streptomyces sp. NBC_01353 TaxID=2903835 RepID=UPI002E32DCBC|nr:hypothetical protein [Streptomyces sp. NBC_01353]